MATDKTTNNEPENEENQFPGYPKYPAEEDIYAQYKEEGDIDPDDITQRKSPAPDPDAPNVKSFRDDVSGSDLDVPGSEYDADNNIPGMEDEENEFFSLGGDDQEANEEYRGE